MKYKDSKLGRYRTGVVPLNPIRSSATKIKRGDTYDVNSHGEVRVPCKFESKCCVCKSILKIGKRVWWNPEKKTVRHPSCKLVD